MVASLQTQSFFSCSCLKKTVILHSIADSLTNEIEPICRTFCSVAIGLTWPRKYSEACIHCLRHLGACACI